MKAYDTNYKNGSAADTSYSSDYSEQSAAGNTMVESLAFDVRNTLIKEPITLKKVWDDSGCTQENLHYPVTFEIKDTNTSKISFTAQTYTLDPSVPAEATTETTVSGNKTWTKQTVDLPVYYSDGTPIEYTVTETQTQKYNYEKTNDRVREETPTGTAHSGLTKYYKVYTITNKLPVTSVPVKKIWDERYPKTRNTPSAGIDVTLKRQASGEASASTVDTVTLTSSHIYEYTFANLLAYDQNNNLYTYSITENTVPTGYNESYSDPVPAVKNGVATQLTVTNTAKYGTAEFTKYDNSYYIVETAAPEGYVLDDTHHEFTISGDTTTENATSKVQEITNSEILSKLRLTKQDAVNDASLANAQFWLLRLIPKELNPDTSLTSEKTGAEYLDAAKAAIDETCGDGDAMWKYWTKCGTYKTDSDGVITVSDLVFGKYLFYEVQAPVGYQRIIDKNAFEIKADNASASGYVHTFALKDPRKKAYIKVLKTDENGEPLSDATFELHKKSDGSKVGSAVTTGNDGMNSSAVMIDTSADGFSWRDKYYFEETASPDGYDADIARIEFSVTEAVAEEEPYIVRANNSRHRGSVELTKKAAKGIGDIGAGDPLPGATFKLCKRSDYNAAGNNAGGNELKVYQYSDKESHVSAAVNRFEGIKGIEVSYNGVPTSTGIISKNDLTAYKIMANGEREPMDTEEKNALAITQGSETIGAEGAATFTVLGTSDNVYGLTATYTNGFTDDFEVQFAHTELTAPKEVRVTFKCDDENRSYFAEGTSRTGVLSYNFIISGDGSTVVKIYHNGIPVAAVNSWAPSTAITNEMSTDVFDGWTDGTRTYTSDQVLAAIMEAADGTSLTFRAAKITTP